MSNKIRLKEIIEGKNIKDIEVFNAQQQTQKKHLIKNQILFEQLTTTLTHRPLTFAKCAFKKAEVEADDQLRPIVKGIYEHKTSGSMLSSDFWSNKQMRKYLKQTELLQSQRVLKRFAHWEWDYNSNKDRFRELSEKFKESIYTQQSEMNTKFKLSSNQGEKRLRKKIIRDWTSEKKIDIKDKLIEFRNNDLPKVKLPVKSVTVHQNGKSNNEIISSIMN
ncbi:hypothetical protein pb186bvf_009915 [Paramecium bursaria]